MHPEVLASPPHLVDADQAHSAVLRGDQQHGRVGGPTEGHVLDVGDGGGRGAVARAPQLAAPHQAQQLAACEGRGRGPGGGMVQGANAGCAPFNRTPWRSGKATLCRLMPEPTWAALPFTRSCYAWTPSLMAAWPTTLLHIPPPSTFLPPLPRSRSHLLLSLRCRRGHGPHCPLQILHGGCTPRLRAGTGGGRACAVETPTPHFCLPHTPQALFREWSAHRWVLPAHPWTTPVALNGEPKAAGTTLRSACVPGSNTTAAHAAAQRHNHASHNTPVTSTEWRKADGTALRSARVPVLQLNTSSSPLLVPSSARLGLRG